LIAGLGAERGSIRFLPRAGPPPGLTMARVHLARFYHRARRQNHCSPSIVEAIASAPSVFAVEGLLDDFRRFTRDASPRTHAQVLETARARICELRGVLP
jgi:hypothetical protein